MKFKKNYDQKNMYQYVFVKYLRIRSSLLSVKRCIRMVFYNRFASSSIRLSHWPLEFYRWRENLFSVFVHKTFTGFCRFHFTFHGFSNCMCVLKRGNGKVHGAD